MARDSIQRLNNTHGIIALMYAAGWKQRRIAEALGYNENRISVICNSPLFQAEAKRLQRELASSTIMEVVDRIALETGRSLDTIIELRDHAENESVRKDCAFGILDRHPDTAKRQRTDEERTLRIVFGREDLARLTAVAAEDGPLSLPSSSTEAPVNGGDGRIVARTLDEALAAARDGDAL